MENKSKEVVPPMDKGKDVVPHTAEEVPPTDDDVVLEEHPSGKRWNYGHYHDASGPTHFRKVILTPMLECIPMLLHFTKHFLAVSMEFKLKANTACSWRVTVKLMHSRVNLNQGWATFAVVHQIKIGYMVTFKLLTPDTLKVIIFNNDNIEVVTKCGRHGAAFPVNV
ncbi:hypothetical protein VPH35_096801 [Triticum aestivum]